MKVYKNVREDTSLCVLALGSFDTIHMGHQQLLLRAKEHAWAYGIQFGVYMFETRPAHMLKSNPQKDVYTASAREEVLHKLGADFVYYETFDAEFMQKTPEAFVLYLKEKLHVNTVVAGFNYRFGKQAAGDSDMLVRLCRQNGIEAIIVPAVCDADGVISSTRIRNLLENGDVETVNQLLGRNYAMSGMVDKDRGVGHQMGVPTANLVFAQQVLLPKDGVYVTAAICDGQTYPAVTNIGIRPTFHLSQRTVETHLLGYNGDLYGKSLKLEFYKRLRDERVFNDVEALKNQILSDKKQAEMLFLKINSEKL